jgi:hypothetical protein
MPNKIFIGENIMISEEESLKIKNYKDIRDYSKVDNSIQHKKKGSYKIFDNLELYYGDLEEPQNKSQNVESEKNSSISNKLTLIVVSAFSFVESIIFIFILPNNIGIITAIYNFFLISSWLTLFNIIFFVPNSKELFLQAVNKLWIDVLYIIIESKLNYYSPLEPKIVENESEKESYRLKLITIK